MRLNFLKEDKLQRQHPWGGCLTLFQVQVSAELEATFTGSRGWEGTEMAPSAIFHKTNGESGTQRGEDTWPESHSKGRVSHSQLSSFLTALHLLHCCNEVPFTMKNSQNGKSLNCLRLGLFFRNSLTSISVFFPNKCLRFKHPMLCLILEE